MAKPTVKVEVAWTDGPYVASPTWSDITSYVRSVSTRRGRTDDWQNFDSGSATIVLDNRDRRFDPTYTTGPNYGNLQPRKQIQITGAALTRKNLCPNPSFETNTTNWTSAGAVSSIVRSTAAFYVGTASALITTSGTGTAQITSDPTNLMAVTAGATYTASAYLRTGTGTRDMRALIIWYNASGTSTGTVNGTTTSVSTTFTRVSVTATAPANTTHAVIRWDIQRSGAAIGNTAYIDAVLFEESASVGSYFDGSSANSFWDGITNNSTSQEYQYVALFRGYVDGWPVKLSQAGFDSTVTITAYEVLGLIAQDQTPADWSRQYVQDLNPKHFWPLDDTIDPTTIPQTSGTLGNLTLRDLGPIPKTLQPVSPSVPIANTDSLAPGIPSRSVTMAASCATVGYATVDSESVNSCTISYWFSPGNVQYNVSTFTAQLLGQSSGRYIIYTLTYNITNQRFEFYMIERATYPGQNTGRVYYFPTALNTALPHHIAITFTDSTATTVLNLALYVDGQSVASSSNTTFLGPPGYGDGGSVYYITGNAQQFAVYFDLKTATQIQTIYRLGNNVLTETTAARFQRVIDETPLPAALYSCTASPAGTVGRLTVGGAFVNNELQLANDSEGGELYTTKAGVLTMTNRTWYQSGTSATSQATFGSGGIPIQTEIDYAWNADNIRNTLDVSWSGDAVVTCTNSSSRTTYGVMQDSWTTALSTYADAQTLGNLLVNFGGLPRLVISAVEVGQALSGANWSTVLGLELLDRITVVVPEPVGSNLTQTQIIQQIEHEITPGDWTTRILGSARWSSVFTIGTSYLDGTDILG